MKYGFSFSLKRALGITALKQKISRKIGIPLTKQGLERKIGGFVLKFFMLLIVVGVLAALYYFNWK